MIRELITTTFEVVGLALLCTAAGLFVAQIVSGPAGLAVAGVLCLCCSALIVARSPKRRQGEEVSG